VKKKTPKDLAKKNSEPTVRKSEATQSKSIPGKINHLPAESILSDRISSTTFYILAIVGLFSMLFLATKAGINGDEDVQVVYAERLLDFYASWGKDQTAFESTKGDVIRYYGGGYEITSALVNKLIGFQPNEPAYHTVRHLMVALWGWLGIFFIGRTAKLLGGWDLAVISLLFMFLSPRFFGEAMWNNKDIPFATGYIIANYYTIKLLMGLPKPSIGVLFGLTVGIALSISIRAGGIIHLGYLGLFGFAHAILQRPSNKSLLQIAYWWHYVKFVLIPAVLGIFIGVLFWPYALINPFAHIYESLQAFSQFPQALKELFNGQLVYSHTIPFEYLFTWIGISTPLFFILGLLLFTGLSKIIIKSHPTILLIFLLFSFLFPIIFVTFKGSPLHQGWRHFYFIYGSGVIVAALGWVTLLKLLQDRKKYLMLPIIPLAILLIEPFVQIVKNPALPYIYFNPVFGGASNAYGVYEMDYQGISTRDAYNWLENQGIIHDEMKDTLTIATNFSYSIQNYIPLHLKDIVRVKYVHYRQRYESNWDYGIFVNRYMDGQYLKNHWPNSRSIYTVNYDRTPVATIYHMASKEPNQAWNQLIYGDLNIAKEILEGQIKEYPDDLLLYEMLMKVYFHLGDLETAYQLMKDCLSHEPYNTNCLAYGAEISIINQNWKEGEFYTREALKYFPGNTMAYKQLGQIQYAQQLYYEAEETVIKGLDYDHNNIGLTRLLADIYEALGLYEEAQYLRSLLNSQ